MENKLVLVDQNLTNSCPAGNKLSKEEGMIFSAAVNKMALAKNIKLAEGTLAVWEECLIEDMTSQEYDFEDFLIATKKVIRETAYNRIDYAEIYKEAIETAYNRRFSTFIYCPFCKKQMVKTTFGELLRSYLGDDFAECKCGKKRNEIRDQLQKEIGWFNVLKRQNKRKGEELDR